jgi:hypothetical protein
MKRRAASLTAMFTPNDFESFFFLMPPVLVPQLADEKGPQILTCGPQLQRGVLVLTVFAPLFILHHPRNRPSECSKCGTLAFNPSRALGKKATLKRGCPVRNLG